MDTTRIDSVAKFFAGRRSRRRMLAEAGGLAATTMAVAGLAKTSSAQESTPPSTASDEEAPVFLFLQAFQAGSVVPKEGAEDRYVLTLEQGLGQTVYFSDRPDRIVGAAPTPKFLEGLGFPDDNPPNAALVVETGEGQTEVVVLQLYAPEYDLPTRTATYEVAVLAEWERQGGTDAGTFTETAADLSAFDSGFGAAHLFIDDCPDFDAICYTSCSPNGDIMPTAGSLGPKGMCWSWDDWQCHPCSFWNHTTAAAECNATFPVCNGHCYTSPIGFC